MTSFYVGPPVVPLTFTAAVQRAKDGDTIHVAPGNYPEDVYIAGKILTIVADPGATVRSIYYKDVNGGSLSGLSVVGSKVPLATTVDTTKPDDPSIPPIKGTLPKAQRDALAAKKWRTVIAAALAYDGPNFSLFTIGIKLVNCSGVRVTGCRASKHTAGISVEQSSRVILEDCEATLCRVGIRGANESRGLVFRRVSAHQNLGSGIELDNAHACVIEDCDSKLNGLHNYILHAKASGNAVRRCHGSLAGWFSETMPYPGSSCYNAYDVGPANVFESNTAELQRDDTGNDGNGFIADTSTYGVTFQSNVVRNCVGNGIALTQTNGNTVIDNNISGCRKTVNAGTTKGNTIRGNSP